MTQQSREGDKVTPNAAGDADIPKKIDSHPVGVGLGAIAAGAAAGAAGGAIAGPVGAVAGIAVGAVAGGLAGEAAAEGINPTTEKAYWRAFHPSRPYASDAMGYGEFESAYEYGWQSFDKEATKTQSFDSVEDELGQRWESVKGASRLTWDQAKHATRDAWNRVQVAFQSRNKSK